MARFSDLPRELFERVCLHLRPPGVALDIDELRAIARVRLVHRAFAGYLSNAVLLSAVWLELSPSKAPLVKPLVKLFRHSDVRHGVKHLVVHGWPFPASKDASDRQWEAAIAAQKCLNYIFDRKSMLPKPETLIFCLGPSILMQFNRGTLDQLKGLRRLAVDCNQLIAIPLLIEGCPLLTELAIIAGSRQCSSCAAWVFHTRLTPGKPFGILDLHLENANSGCMLQLLPRLPFRPTTVSISVSFDQVDNFENFAQLLARAPFTLHAADVSMSGNQDETKTRLLTELMAQERPAAKLRFFEHAGANRPPWVVMPRDPNTWKKEMVDFEQYFRP